MSAFAAPRLARACASLLCLSATLLLAGAAAAQSVPGRPAAKASATPGPSPAPEAVPEAPDSPRSSVRAFVDLASRKGDFKAAARYLQLPAGEEARGPEESRRLRA